MCAHKKYLAELFDEDLDAIAARVRDAGAGLVLEKHALTDARVRAAVAALAPNATPCIGITSGCGFAGAAMMPKVIVRVLFSTTPAPCVAGLLGEIRLACSVRTPSFVVSLVVLRSSWRAGSAAIP